MKKLIGLIFILFTFSNDSFAMTEISCDPPQGTRMDYFSYNNINLQNETFLMARDKAVEIKPAIQIENHMIIFSLNHSEEMKLKEVKILHENEDQISFTGMINGAPLLATYYPKLKILIYSQQSVWPGPDYIGARAVIFHSKCKEKR